MPIVAETPTTTSPTSSEMRAPDEHAREDVASELVEAEPVRRGRALEPQRQLLIGGIERHQHRADDRGHDGSRRSPRLL